MSGVAISLGKILAKQKQKPSGVPLRMVLTNGGIPVRLFTVYATRRRERFGLSYHAKTKVIKPKRFPITYDDLWLVFPDGFLRIVHLDLRYESAKTCYPGNKITFYWDKKGILRVWDSLF